MKVLTILCLLIMTAIAHSPSSNSGTFESVQAPRDVALDTDSGSAFWQGATPAYIAGDTWGKAVPNDRAEVRSRWTKDSLYLLFICPYEKLTMKPNPRTDTETNHLWNWDVAEAFIGSDFHDIRHYKEFEVSPQGEWVDLDIDLDRPRESHDWTWNSGFQVAARIDRRSKIWYGAMRIPFAAIDARDPHSGTILRVNLFRVEGSPGDRKLLSWQPTMSDTFHVPERFGRLLLVDSH